MFKRRIIVLFLFVFITRAGNAQTKNPDGGGSYQHLADVRDEITTEQRSAIITMLQANEERLRKDGRLQKINKAVLTKFIWPLRQAPGYNDNGYYGISNYVDENPAFPNSLLDYNCGNRTYDLSTGYNHKGTDIFIWPFSWQKMERDVVQIVAGAPGTILAKSDGNFDQNCAFCSGPCNWNAVYVIHADGSVAWYGHMKSGSLTGKGVGQPVSAGEYLGVVGSSGNSTAPHLHLEIYTNSSYTQLVDPWAGPCNNMNGMTSWWETQQPYYVPTLSKVMTHSAAPGTGNCPGGEAPNEKINFANGEQLFLGSYYRDHLVGHQSIHTIYRPDNTVFNTWTQTFNAYYAASWWYYIQTLPNPAMSGTWRYEIVYNGTQKQTAFFAVNSANVLVCPYNYNVLTSNITGASYQWQVNTGSGFSNIANNLNYSGVNTNQLQLKILPPSFYGYQYRCVVNGGSFSNVISLKFTSFWTGSVSKAWEDPANWSCGTVPDGNTDVIIQSATNLPEVSSNATCRSTTLPAGTNITVKAGFRLNVMR